MPIHITYLYCCSSSGNHQHRNESAHFSIPLDNSFPEPSCSTCLYSILHFLSPNISIKKGRKIAIQTKNYNQRKTFLSVKIIGSFNLLKSHDQ